MQRDDVELGRDPTWPGSKMTGLRSWRGECDFENSREKKSLSLPNFRLVIKGEQRLYAGRHEDSEDRRYCNSGIQFFCCE